MKRKGIKERLKWKGEIGKEWEGKERLMGKRADRVRGKIGFDVRLVENIDRS